MFKRGTVELAVLAVLQKEDMYGYQIVQKISSLSEGRFTLPLGTLYPVLYRLEEQGFIEISSTEVSDGRARSYYAITEAGRKHLEKTMGEYEEISRVFMDMMK